MDLCAPLLHEFTYQAMINDLLEVEDEGKRYKCVCVVLRYPVLSWLSSFITADTPSGTILAYLKNRRLRCPRRTISGQKRGICI